MSTDPSDGPLADRLLATWRDQAEDGFLLSSTDPSAVEILEAPDPISGVLFRFRWMPHREIRADIEELERRGIVNPDRDEAKLFADPRDPRGRYCFLCPDNIRETNPLERLVPLRLAERDYLAGANFAWIAANHFTVLAAEHVDQDFTEHTLDAMVDLHRQTGGRFRVLYNGAGAGATIPWHLHYQLTTEPFPVEGLASEETYPTPVTRLLLVPNRLDAAREIVEDWTARDPDNHRVNLLISGSVVSPQLHVFARDRRRTHAVEKGLVGGFEVCGDFVYSEPPMREWFDRASAGLARRILAEVRPPSVPEKRSQGRGLP